MICEKCGKKHDGLYGSGRFCSSECSHSFSAKINNQQRVKNIKNSAEICIKEGRHNNFSGNGNIIEKFWEKELIKHGLDVKHNYPVLCNDIDNNNHYYRMDFLIDNIIDLEIDGDVFHRNAEKDKRRDQYLNRKGYLVYRAPYVNPNRRYKTFIKQVLEFVDWNRRVIEKFKNNNLCVT